MRIKRFVCNALFLCFAMLAMAGCNIDVSPIESASVKSIENGRPQKAWTLSPSQVRALNAWMKENRGGWQSSLTNYAPTYLLNITHADGQQSTLNVSQKVAVLVYKGEQFAQKLDSTEMNSLTGILLGGATE